MGNTAWLFLLSISLYLDHGGVVASGTNSGISARAAGQVGPPIDCFEVDIDYPYNDLYKIKTKTFGACGE